MKTAWIFIIFTILIPAVRIGDNGQLPQNSPINGYSGSSFAENIPATTHNCRLWGAISDSFPDSQIYNQLVVYPRSLKHVSIADNTDGWGIADYDGFGAVPDVVRGAVRAINDTLYDQHVSLLETTKPDIIIGHVRFCNIGCCCHECDSIPDPHPFIREKNGRRWTFAHNGYVDKSLLYNLIGEEYLQNNPPTGSGIPECDPSDTSLIVDSELLFIYVLKRIEEANWNIPQGFINAVVTVFVNDHTSTMNLMLSDGYNLWAFKRGWNLFYVYDQAQNYSAAASHIPTLDPGLWQAAEEFGLLELGPSTAPIITDVLSYLPGGFYVPGDANGSLSFSGLDVTYSINYFKGNGPSPPDTLDCPGHGLIAAAADANGSCSFNGLDVTYCINFFKGQGSPPTFCPACPPDTSGI